MRINERQLHGATVLEIRGMLTSPVSADLLDAVRRLATAGPPRLVLHLGGVAAIDAAGLGTLVAAYRVVMTNGGTLTLAHVARRVRTLLEICRLASLFAAFDSVDAAVAACAETAFGACAADS